MTCFRATLVLSLSSIVSAFGTCAFDAAMHRTNPFQDSESCKADEAQDHVDSALSGMSLQQGLMLLQHQVKHRSGDPGTEELQTILAEMSNVVSTRGHQPTAAPEAATAAPATAAPPATPAVASAGGDSFARIAPFGKEDTAQELQHHAARTQDTLVDAVENAEVAEIKRAVFRALTRLRAASIKEFDTIARLETQAIDEYNDAHHYRAENPLSYLHADEPQVTEDKFTSFH